MQEQGKPKTAQELRTAEQELGPRWKRASLLLVAKTQAQVAVLAQEVED